jgi:RND family efflux transporter MFP subunit
MRRRLSITIWSMTLLLSACGQQQEEPQQTATAERATRVTVATADARTVEVIDSAVGVIESESAPMLTAEVAGRLTQVLADTGDAVRRGDVLAVVDPESYRLAQAGAMAEVRRLQALVDQQARQVERQRQLAKENFVSAAAVDEAVSQLAALREQLAAARTRLDQARRDVAQTEVRAPIDGVVDQRLVAAGDYVGRGQPLFRLVSQEVVTVRLPFPETVAARLRAGLTVRLSSPTAPAQEVTGTIKEVRPALSAGSRALEVIVELPNPGGWRVGGSARGRVVLDVRRTVVVPEISVVERPAGKVVYVVADGKAQAREVETGIRRDGWVEILQGLAPGAVVAADGAAFLSDGAAVQVQARQQEGR